MNLATVPEWAWIALAVAAAFLANKHGYFDGFLKKPAPTNPQPAPPVVYQYAPAIQAVPPQVFAEGGEGQPVLEKLVFRGPVRIAISGGKIELSA
jgi:hypothetical protein